MKTDKNLGKYNCESCGKVSFSRANAEMHAASRSEEKRLKCMNCGKEFASQTYLIKPAHKKGNGHRQNIQLWNMRPEIQQKE